jgi:hypothetical protein
VNRINVRCRKIEVFFKEIGLKESPEKNIPVSFILRNNERQLAQYVTITLKSLVAEFQRAADNENNT